MSDRPTPANGKRNQAWGTTNACPQCGECLCFGCHPHGPCVDSPTTSGADTCYVDADVLVGGGGRSGSWAARPENSQRN